ncbi:MAG: hypothetical protein AAB523_02945 [Patescibacteria group bacterium]
MLDSRVPQNVKAHMRAQKEVQATELAPEKQVQLKKEHMNGMRKKRSSPFRLPQYGYR